MQSKTRISTVLNGETTRGKQCSASGLYCYLIHLFLVYKYRCYVVRILRSILQYRRVQMNIARNPSSSTIPLSRQRVLPIKLQQLSHLRTVCIYTWQQEQYRELPERSSRCRYFMVIERDEAMIADWLFLVSLNMDNISIREPTICLKYWLVGFVTQSRTQPL